MPRVRASRCVRPRPWMLSNAAHWPGEAFEPPGQPQSGAGGCLLTGAPGGVADKQLEERHVASTWEPEEA